MGPGKIYIIATPIGNLEDITYRAVRILKEEVTAVFCEDTRQTKKLLDHYGIRLPLSSLHAHSPQKRFDELIGLVGRGATAAYCTDSGTPSISDPGSKIVSQARDAGLSVIPLPGPSALSTILSVSGFSHDTVLFAGFMSKKEGRRARELSDLKLIPGIIILYESPYRIKRTLASVAGIFPGAPIVIGREMTKHFEEYISGTIEEVIARIDELKEKGEFTVAILNSERNDRVIIT